MTMGLRPRVIRLCDRQTIQNLELQRQQQLPHLGSRLYVAPYQRFLLLCPEQQAYGFDRQPESHHQCQQHSRQHL